MNCLQLQVLDCLNCEGGGSKVQRYLIRGDADTFLATPIFRCRRTESIVSLKKGSFHVTN